jgi:carbonic anhydrase/acetyltransferase-like protein (isoleucine patch superfamily)
MLLAIDRMATGRARDSLSPGLRALLADPRLVANRGLGAALLASCKHRVLLPRRFVRALRRAPRSSRADLWASILWSARTGEVVLLARGTNLDSDASGVALAPRSELMVGFRDLSPAHGARIEVERGGRLDIEGRVELMHGAWVRVKPGARLAIQGGTYVMSESILWCREAISIGPRCAISWRAQILDTDEHHHWSGDAARRATYSAPVWLGEHVWIGTGAVVLKGVVLCDGAVVAAGSVVTRDVEARTLVLGNPARAVRHNVDWR